MKMRDLNCRKISFSNVLSFQMIANTFSPTLTTQFNSQWFRISTLTSPFMVVFFFGIIALVSRLQVDQGSSLSLLNRRVWRRQRQPVSCLLVVQTAKSAVVVRLVAKVTRWTEQLLHCSRRRHHHTLDQGWQTGAFPDALLLLNR